MYKNIIALFGMPRSGTSWISQIINSSPDVKFRMEPIFAYAHKNAVNDKSTRSDFDKFFTNIYTDDDDYFMNQMDKREKGLYPLFDKYKNPHRLLFKTTRFHYLPATLLKMYNDDELKIVVIVRNPCGAINSWLKNSKEFPKEANIINEWRNGACRKTAREEYWGFTDWVNVMNMYIELEKQYVNMKIFQYEEFVTKKDQQVYALFDFINLSITEQTKEYLNICHKRNDDDPYSVFKSPEIIHSWDNELESSIKRAIYSELTGGPLSRFLV